MTRDEINRRIDLLYTEIRFNEEENSDMESEIEDLEAMLEQLDKEEE